MFGKLYFFNSSLNLIHLSFELREKPASFVRIVNLPQQYSNLLDYIDSGEGITLNANEPESEHALSARKPRHKLKKGDSSRIENAESTISF